MGSEYLPQCFPYIQYCVFYMKLLAKCKILFRQSVECCSLYKFGILAPFLVDCHHCCQHIDHSVQF